MSNIDSTCLEAFPRWLAQLPEDVVTCGKLATSRSLPEVARLELAAAINYVFKSLDLIPDGVEELGYLDDALVLRVCAARCCQNLDASSDAPDSQPETELSARLSRLSREVSIIDEFLGETSVRLHRYCEGLVSQEVRGRTAPQILGEAEVAEQWLDEVATWADGFTVPSFVADDKALIKIRAFLQAKLPG